MRIYDIPLFFLLLCPALSVPSASAQDLPEGISFSADFLSTSIRRDQVSDVVKGRVYISPPSVRLEPEAHETSKGYKEIFLYDFDEKKQRRVFLDDQIYFETPISEKSFFKAMQEGWIPWEDAPDIKRRWIRLKEDFMHGHPCVLELLERSAEVPTGKDDDTTRVFSYSLYWKATDLNHLPVRIVYFPRNQRVVIVDYSDIKVGKTDAALFLPPEGFLNLNPF